MKIVIFTVFIIAALSLSLLLLPPALADVIMDENGPVENTQFILYGMAACMAWAITIRRTWSKGLIVGMILLLFMLRELDFHERFTVMSITKTKFYFSPVVPLTEKLIAVTVIGAIIGIAYILIRNNVKPLFNDVKEGKTWAVLTVLGIALLAVSAFLDGCKRYVAALNIALTESGATLIDNFEEVGELAIPAVFLIALWEWSGACRLDRSHSAHSFIRDGLLKKKEKDEDQKEAYL